VVRGSLQTTFDYKPYDEVRRLGLRPELEAKLRKVNHGVGLLVVRRSLPETVAHKRLMPGDILIKGGESGDKLHWLRRFDELEALLDDNVGRSVKLLLERSGQEVEVNIRVDDLHELTPDRYLTFGQAIVHNLSYQQARHLNRSVKGVYVAQPGYILSTAGIPRGAVILSVKQQPVNNIDDVEAILNELTDRQQVSVRYITFNETKRVKVSVIRMDRRWFTLKKCYRDDTTGVWPCETLADNQSEQIIDTAKVKFIKYKDERANRLSSSIVSVQFDIPYNINGVEESHYYGAGLIINKADGLVLVDRNTVPVSPGDVRLVFAGALDIPAKVIFIHPLHNFAIVQYKPEWLGDTEVEEASISDRVLEAGDDVWLIALKNTQELLVEETKISAIDALEFEMPKIPSFRELNLDVMSLKSPSLSRGGVLSDEDGEVLAIWASFAYNSGGKLKQHEWAVSAEFINDLLEQWDCCKKFEIRSLEVGLATLSIAQARKLGLSDEWTERMQVENVKRQVLAVSRIVAGSDASKQLQEGDLILTVDGEVVRTFRDIERLTQKDKVLLSINRLGNEMRVSVKTELMDGSGTQEIIQWAGALIQRPHRELALQRGIEPQGVYVSYVFHGGPANRSSLNAQLRIVEFNSEMVEDLTQFKALAEKYKNDKFVQLKVLDLINRESVISLKQNQYYWPSRQVSKVNGEWKSY